MAVGAANVHLHYYLCKNTIVLEQCMWVSPYCSQSQSSSLMCGT